MSLPSLDLPVAEVEISPGVLIKIRSLSRDETIKLTQFEDVAEAEVFILSRSTGVTDAEAQTFREQNQARLVGTVLEEISILSGIKEARDEKGKK